MRTDGNAPLTAENATRVMETLRRVSFAGVASDWVTRDPDDRWVDWATRDPDNRWVDQLRRLRQSSST